MNMRHYNLIRTLVAIAYGDGDGNTDPNKDKKPETFTKEQVDQLVADKIKETEKALKTKLTNTVNELQALQQKQSLTAEDRAELETRLNTLQSELMTKEELAKQQAEKLKKEKEEEVKKTSSERDHWKNRYVDTSIQRSLTDAAAKHDAYNPSQIVSILRGNTKLVEVIGEDGKPTGEFVAKATVRVISDGKPKDLEMDVDQAVKTLKEQDDYANLFKGKGTGGTGGGNSGAGKTDIHTLAKDPAKYREARKKGLI